MLRKPGQGNRALGISSTMGEQNHPLYLFDGGDHPGHQHDAGGLWRVMHVSVGFKWGRDEQSRAGMGMKSCREVRPALIHHTKVVSVASLCGGSSGEKSADTFLLQPYKQSPPILFTLLQLGKRFGPGMLFIPCRTSFLKHGPMDNATRRISQRLEICRSTIKPQEFGMCSSVLCSSSAGEN